MIRWACGFGVALILGGACKMDDEIPDYGCSETQTNCRVVSGWAGYTRACATTCTDQAVAFNRGDDERDRDGSDDDSPRAERDADEPSATDGATPEAAAANLGPAAPPDMTRYSAFDIPCERDSQCGPGQCEAGNCYYGCQSDAQCGSGDRCSVEGGVRVCQPDPNPRVECTRSAQCDTGFGCLNGACRQTCSSTQQCTNVLDRCGSGFCVPDRRPLGECVLNSECANGLVCLDGACVPACPAQGEEDGNVCLAEPPGAAPGADPSSEGSVPTEGTTPAEPPAPTEEPSTEDTPTGEDTSEPDEDDTPVPDESSPDAGTPIPIIN